MNTGFLNAGPPGVFENLMMQIKEVSKTNGVNEWWLGSGGMDFITLRYLIVIQIIEWFSWFL